MFKARILRTLIKSLTRLMLMFSSIFNSKMKKKRKQSSSVGSFLTTLTNLLTLIKEWRLWRWIGFS
jgi:hypothetical protein